LSESDSVLLHQLLTMFYSIDLFRPIEGVKLGSGMFTRHGAEEFMDYLASSQLYKNIQDIRYSVVSAGLPNCFISQVNGFDYAPRSTVVDAFENKKYVSRLNINPYLSDYYKHSVGALDQIHHESYIDKILATSPEQYQHIINTVGTSIEDFGYYKDLRDIMKIEQSDFINEVDTEIRGHFPKCFEQFETRLTLQKIFSGTFTQTHRDPDRKAHLFYLLTPSNVKTVWYTVRPEYRYVKNHFGINSYGSRQAFKQYEIIIEPDKWYLFNNQDLHSVHNLTPELGDKFRLALTIDFISTDYYTVANALAKNNFTLS